MKSPILKVGIGLAALSAGGVALLCGLVLRSTTEVSTLYQAQCEGKTLLFQKVEKKTFEMIYYSTRIVWGDKAPVALSEMLGNGLPYQTSVYGKAPFRNFEVAPQFYRYAGTQLRKLPTVIYLDPALYSLSEFEALARCLKAHGGAISRSLDGQKNLQQFQLVGLVYGREGDFVERFTRNSKDWIEIAPGGGVTRIQLDYGGIKGMKSSSTGGLSSVGPDRVIQLEDPKEMSLAALKSYKNEAGQALPEKFSVIVGVIADKAATPN